MKMINRSKNMMLSLGMIASISFTACQKSEDTVTDEITEEEVIAQELDEMDIEQVLFDITEVAEQATASSSTARTSGLGVTVEEVDKSVLIEKMTELGLTSAKTSGAVSFFQNLADSTVSISFFNGVNNSVGRLFNRTDYTGDIIFNYNTFTRTSTVFANIVIDESVSFVGVFRKSIESLEEAGPIKTITYSSEATTFINYEDGRTANRSGAGTVELVFLNDEIVSAKREGAAFGKDVKGRLYDVSILDPLFHSPAECVKRFPISGVRQRVLTSESGVTKKYVFDFGDNECNNNFDLTVETL